MSPIAPLPYLVKDLVRMDLTSVTFSLSTGRNRKGVKNNTIAT